MNNLTPKQIYEADDLYHEYLEESGMTKPAWIPEAKRSDLPTGQYDTRLKIDSRTGSAAKLKYVEDVVAETPKAICFRVCDYTQGGWYDTWFPKKLCSNLDPVEKTFWVWIKFLEQNEPDLIPKGYRMKGDNQ